jgi:flavin reductase (DIM6/NTAB) family NADH-FMN oxidoreductase RutF
MLITPESVSKRDLYAYMTRLITPRPIAWVSTRSLAGVDNLAPFSYFNAVGTSPAMLMFCPANRADGSKKDTLINVEQTGEFVVNVVSANLAAAMNQSSGEYDSDESEFDHCGLTREPSSSVAPPRVREATAAFECVLHSVIILGTGAGGANMVIGKIVAIHVADDCLDTSGQIDADRVDSIGRMGGDGYALTRQRMELPRPKV